MRKRRRSSIHKTIAPLIAFQPKPLKNAARYEPVKSKMYHDIHPPSAMPNKLAIRMTPMRAPASFAGKYSRTMMA